MGATEPTDVRDSGPPAHPRTPARAPEGGTRPPLGLPAREPRAPEFSAKPERIAIAPRSPAEPAPRWYDPRPFIRRHEIGILRALAVIALIIILLILWQGVATGLGAEDAPPAGDEPAAEEEEEVFDAEKFAEYLAAQEALRAARASEGSAATADPSATAGAGVSAIGPPAAPSATAGARAGAIRGSSTGPGAGAAHGEAVLGPVAAPAPAATPPLGAGALLPAPPWRGADEPAARAQAPLEGPAAPSPLLAIPAEDLAWQDGFSFALSLQAEFAEAAPAEIPALRAELTRWLLEFGRIAGPGDNPLERLGALLELLRKGPRIAVTDVEGLATLLPAQVLAGRRAGPTGWCTLALALSDRLRALELEPVVCSGAMGLRYQNGAHRYVISPAAPDRVLTDREFALLVSGGRDPVAPIVPLSRAEFCGRALAVGGGDRIAAGAWSRGFELLDRALALDPRQPAALLALARARIERGEVGLALETIAAAAALDPADLAARRARADLLCELGREEEAAADLAALAGPGAPAADVLRHVRALARRGEHRRAEEALAALADRALPAEVAAEVDALANEIAAAPWIAIVREDGDDLARLAATRRLARFPGPHTEAALIELLDDPNGRLSSCALATLRELTGFHGIPRDPARWRRAIAERGR